MRREKLPLHPGELMLLLAKIAFNQRSLFVPGLVGYNHGHPQKIARALDWNVKRRFLLEVEPIGVEGRKLRAFVITPIGILRAKETAESLTYPRGYRA